MAEKLKNVENETNSVESGIWQETLKNVEKEKCTMQGLQYCEKTENETQTLYDLEYDQKH